MNLNNLTKAELISKFNQLKNEKLESKIDSDKAKQDNRVKKVTENKNQNLPTIWDIILKLKTLILSLTIVGLLLQIFKKYN
jgi:hypothetical protein